MTSAEWRVTSATPHPGTTLSTASTQSAAERREKREESTSHFSLLASCFSLLFLAFSVTAGAAPQAPPSQEVFRIGKPDGSPMEFGLVDVRWPQYLRRYPNPVVFTVGQSQLTDWPYIHPSTHDGWAGSKPHTFTIRFRVEQAVPQPLHLIIGALAIWEPSQISITVNDKPIASRRLPNEVPVVQMAGEPEMGGQPLPLVFRLPDGSIKPGENSLGISLNNGSWMIYDYVLLATNGEPPKIAVETHDLLKEFLAGPMAGVEDIIFAERQVLGEHWYANFGYYAAGDGKTVPNRGGKLYRDGAKLCKLHLAGRKSTCLLEDSKGGIRDPQVHYDGHKILFSYRKGGTENYHLYEINIDGGGLKQLTDGLYDDIEPSYLPDGGIVFVSSRCKRWVNCWLTQVAVLHHCNGDGSNIQPLSSNNEHDNTPWPLPDGRILYTRWEYVDRSQVDFHHLWVANPDGTGQMAYFGNLHPGTVMIDAKPIPGTDKVVASFSPGHGETEHAGAVTVIDPKAGPDESAAARRVSRQDHYRDPWAFSEDCFMAAAGTALVLMNQRGVAQELFRLPDAEARAGFQLHEPRPLLPRPREPLMAARASETQATGRLFLQDICNGRNMKGLQSGEIKKLLVLESLPKPINYTGGMEPLSYGGSFTLERILGTVPVEPDGSAYMELPALRSLFFLALDGKDLAVKRMQSFLTVMPGETTGCVGCHEPRVRAPSASASQVQALRRAPSEIQPIAGAPEVFDFPRDVQPVLDALCVSCHGYEKTPAGGPRAGRIILSGDRGPMFSHSYYTLTTAGLFSDGRNQARSNYAPRTLGSSASRILTMLDGSHYGVQAAAAQKQILRLWIDAGAPYPGTYAALGSGMIGGYDQNNLVNTDLGWPATKAASQVLTQRCAGCHQSEPSRLLPLNLSDERGVSFWQPDMRDPKMRTSRHIVLNLTRPEKSILLLAPLAESAGGWGLCRDPKTKARAEVFAGAADPDYQKLLAMCVAGKERLEPIKRFDMPGFKPRPEWVREMKRYGILPESLKPDDCIDVYETERRYWRSLWYKPPDQGLAPPTPPLAGPQ